LSLRCGSWDSTTCLTRSLGGPDHHGGASEFLDGFRRREAADDYLVQQRLDEVHEQFYPDLIENISTLTASPMSMTGALIKGYFADKIGVAPEKILSVRRCVATAKKYEARGRSLWLTGPPRRGHCGHDARDGLDDKVGGD